MKTRFLAAALVLAPTLAWAQASAPAKPGVPVFDPPKSHEMGHQMGHQMGGGMSQGAPGSAAADEGYMRAMQGMQEATAGMKPSGDPDRDFVSMMIPHHQAAVDMARVELRYGRDPKLRAMAREIVRSQEREIRTMRAWQARQGR